MTTRPAGEPKRPPRFSLGVGLLLYTGVSLLWSFPTAFAPLNMLPSRQFDGWLIDWFAQATPTWPSAFASAPSTTWTETTGWPVGEPLHRGDSLLLPLIKALIGGDPGLISRLLVLFGPVLSALAAQTLAEKGTGARFPASLIAGLAWGFGGTAPVALLEGHVYQLFNPWTPLAGLGYLLVLQSRVQLGPHTLRPLALGSSLCMGSFVGALLGSGYQALLTLTLLATLAIGHLPRWREFSWRLRLIGLGLPCCCLALALTYAMRLSATGEEALGGSAWQLSQGAAHLDSISGWSSAIDLGGHSATPTLPLLALAVVLLWPAQGRHRAERLGLGVAALFSFVLAFGPGISLWGIATMFPLPLSWVSEFPSLGAVRFPLRWLGLCSLSLGLLAAHRLHHERWAPLLVILACCEVGILSGLPGRLSLRSAAAPTVFAHSPPDQGILELFPEDAFGDPLHAHWNRRCAWQAHHGRPLVQTCINTRSGERTWNRLSRATFDSLVRGEDPTTHLENLGIGAIVVEPALFGTTDRRALIHAATRRWGQGHQSTDQGVHLYLWTLPNPSDRASAAQTFATLVDSTTGFGGASPTPSAPKTHERATLPGSYRP